MSCCYGKRMGRLMVTDAQPAPVEEPEGDFIEKASGGAQQIGMAFAVGAVLYQIFGGTKRGKKSRRRRKR